MRCPNCKKESITILKRLNLRPNKRYTCKECDEKFFISPIHSIMAILPIFIVGQLQLRFKIKWNYFILVEIIAGIICIVIHIFFIPLLPEKKDKD